MMNPLRSTALALALTGMAATAVPAVAATTWHGADSSPVAQDSWQHGRERDRGYYNQGYGRGYYGQSQYPQNYYGEPVYASTRTWRGEDGRYYCKKKNGTTGLIIGGAAGALIGRSIVGNYGDRTLGTILGAAGGALLGRSIDKNSSSRCR